MHILYIYIYVRFSQRLRGHQVKECMRPFPQVSKVLLSAYVADPYAAHLDLVGVSANDLCCISVDS